MHERGQQKKVSNQPRYVCPKYIFTFLELHVIHVENFFVINYGIQNL